MESERPEGKALLTTTTCYCSQTPEGGILSHTGRSSPYYPGGGRKSSSLPSNPANDHQDPANENHHNPTNKNQGDPANENHRDPANEKSPEPSTLPLPQWTFIPTVSPLTFFPR